MENQVQPIFIMPEGTQRTTGKNAQSMNIMAAKMVADTVRTTLGPKGMDKLIVNSIGDTTVTNDGVTILEEMQLEHPVAKMIVEIAKTQEDEVGDGTTTAVIIAGELLKKAGDLIESNVHPTVISKGYRLAEAKAIEVLNEIALDIDDGDDEILKKIAMTTMTGKGAESSKEKLSEIVVKAVTSVEKSEDIKIEKQSGHSIEESELINGVVIEQPRINTSMPSKIENAKIAVLDSEIQVKSPELNAEISITDPEKLKEFLDQEEEMVTKMAIKIQGTGANVIITQKSIEAKAQEIFAKKGIYAATRVKESDIRAIAKATGAKVITDIESIKESDLGTAGLVEEIKTNDINMTYIKDCKNPKSLTILVKGGTDHIVDEVKRAVEDSIGVLFAVLKDKKFVPGAGAIEIVLSKHLRDYANTLKGKEQLAVNVFADSIEAIPKTLAENAGLDPIDILTALKSSDVSSTGIDVFTGETMDVIKEGIIEPMKIKTQAIGSATDVAVMILRIDDLIMGKVNEAPPQPGMQ